MHHCVRAAAALCADDDNDAVLFEKIKKGNYDADDPIWEHISVGAKDAVARLLTVDTRKRLTAAQALMHPWIDKGIRTPSSLQVPGPCAVRCSACMCACTCTS